MYDDIHQVKVDQIAAAKLMVQRKGYHRNRSSIAEFGMKKGKNARN